MQALFRQPVGIYARASYGSTSSTTVGPSIELRNVFFRYPNRQDRTVLADVNIIVQPGEHVALVGGSGGGKITIISLIERLFDPDNVKVMFGSNNIKDLNLKNYRSQLALVSQSPTLFDGTIRDNIVFGVENGSPSEVSCSQAARNKGSQLRERCFETRKFYF